RGMDGPDGAAMVGTVVRHRRQRAGLRLAAAPPHRCRPMIAAGASVGQLQGALPLDPLENRILLCHALGLTRVGLITQSERIVDEAEAAALARLVARRQQGEPIAYIVGKREFYGLDFQVSD